MKWHVSTNLNGPEPNKYRYTTFHWFQHIIPAKNGVGGVALVALATRSCIRVVALTVPVHRSREPDWQAVWEGQVEGDGWPCRLRWNHTHSADGKVHLAVGKNGGKLVILSWPLPTEWGGANQWAEPDITVVWGEEDGMAVRHIAWQLHPTNEELPWLVFAKSSTLIAVQLPPVPSEDRPTHITIYGVHSRSVSGLTCLHGNQFISCSLDGSVAKFTLTESHESHVTSTGSHESHVTPTAVEIGTVCGERQMQGLAVSEHGLFAAFLTSEGGASVSSKQKNTSHLHFSPLLPLSHIHPNTVSVSWDFWEAIRQHRVSKQPLPENIPSSAAREDGEVC
ncbi:hypothetical protein GBAR_LOCUS20204 [Geodia barretti]|nr:hypothetical protein GBAR_LOCUS20204 [Geodia barretti]